MKKPAILIFIFFVTCAVYSLDAEGSLDFGILGLGISSEKGIFDGIIFGHVPDITFQTSVGFGMNLSLMDFSFGFRELNIISLTFINALIFYDFIKDKDIIFGPFCSLNMINYDRVDYFKFKSGLTFSLRDSGDGGIFSFNYLYLESGYKYDNTGGEHSIYIQFGVNLLWPMLIGGSMNSNRDNSASYQIPEKPPVF
jgi:hypothetical protein